MKSYQNCVTNSSVTINVDGHEVSIYSGNLGTCAHEQRSYPKSVDPANPTPPILGDQDSVSIENQRQEDCPQKNYFNLLLMGAIRQLANWLKNFAKGMCRKGVDYLQEWVVKTFFGVLIMSVFAVGLGFSKESAPRPMDEKILQISALIDKLKDSNARQKGSLSTIARRECHTTLRKDGRILEEIIFSKYFIPRESTQLPEISTQKHSYPRLGYEITNICLALPHKLVSKVASGVRGGGTVGNNLVERDPRVGGAAGLIRTNA